MYHPTIQKLDSVAIEIAEVQPELSKQFTLICGHWQRQLQKPYSARYFDAQWCWALGHLGILYQAIRWFRKTQLILETKGKVSNQYFLNALKPYITVVDELSQDVRDEAMHNAVYFGCPDGVNHVHDWVKIVEKECKDVHLLELSETDKLKTETLLTDLGVKRPYVALQARHMTYDPKRNVSVDQVNQALKPYLQDGYSVVSTGLDPHPVKDQFPQVRNQHESFLLSAFCDQFVGSDSGAWVIPWAFNRPVELINDKTKAWFYE